MAATQAQVDNLVGLLDGYAQKGGHHLNVNVLNRDPSGRTGTPGEISAAYHPCIRICRKLHQADKGTAG